MSDFGEGRRLVGNKDHRCEWCGEKIPKGERHYQYKGKWDGEWQNWRMHEECIQAAKEDDDGLEGFMSYDHERPKRIEVGA